MGTSMSSNALMVRVLVRPLYSCEPWFWAGAQPPEQYTRGCLDMTLLTSIYRYLAIGDLDLCRRRVLSEPARIWARVWHNENT